MNGLGATDHSTYERNSFLLAGIQGAKPSGEYTALSRWQLMVQASIAVLYNDLSFLYHIPPVYLSNIFYFAINLMVQYPLLSISYLLLDGIGLV